ncbi:MAG TPA: iron-sulfur cluster assembly protein, partial [Polyangiaceae bacterium]|nr:iron-sulfur cluster assembly protein [Polyangiaceae bacterium]
MAVSKQTLLDAVRGISVPGLQGSLLDLRMITELDVDAAGVRVVLASPDPGYAQRAELAALVQQRLGAVSAGLPVVVTWKAE